VDGCARAANKIKGGTMNELPITFKLMPAAMLVGLLFILISLPLLYNAIGPNWLYGFRTRKTLSNPDIWYKANKYMAKELTAAGIVIIMLALISLAVHLTLMMFTSIQAIALFILVLDTPLTIAVLRSALYLKKL
jgi:hypothetical protein